MKVNTAAGNLEHGMRLLTLYCSRREYVDAHQVFPPTSTMACFLRIEFLNRRFMLYMPGKLLDYLGVAKPTAPFSLRLVNQAEQNTRSDTGSPLQTRR